MKDKSIKERNQKGNKMEERNRDGIDNIRQKEVGMKPEERK